MSMPEPQRTSTAYRRDLWLARQVIGQLRDQALESGDTFHVGDCAFDAAALDACGTGWTGWTPTSGRWRSWTACARAPKAGNGRHEPGGSCGGRDDRQQGKQNTPIPRPAAAPDLAGQGPFPACMKTVSTMEDLEPGYPGEGVVT